MQQDRTGITDELRAAIHAEGERIDVAPYYAMAMNKGLKGHAMGFWSGTFMGLVTGSLAGTILHLTAGAALAASGLAGAPIILGIAGIGATIGGVVGSRVGSTAGAVSGVMMEFERRMLAEKLEADILASPEKQREVLAHYHQRPVAQKDDTVSEIFNTSPSKSAAWKQMILPGTMLLTTLLCGAAGAVMAAGAFLLSGGTGIGLGALGVASLDVAALAGAGLGAASGISFGIYYPAIFAELAGRTGTLLSGETATTLFAPSQAIPAPAFSMIIHQATPKNIDYPDDQKRPALMEPASQINTHQAQHEGITSPTQPTHMIH